MQTLDVRIPDANSGQAFATITINRPQSLNALDREILSELSIAIKEVEKAREDNTSLSAIVLKGEGEKAFVAGADIKFMQEADNLALEEFSSLARNAFTLIEQSPLIVIAAVDGFALGGGMELALACDFIVASSRAKFGQPEVNLGLIPGFGGTQRLSQRVGIGTCKRLVLTGETISGKTGSELGLVDFFADDIEDALQMVIEPLSSKSTVALSAAKRAIDSFYHDVRIKGLETESREFLGIFDSADAREGLAAFIDKRKPDFKGK
jgi:enoyl-CoA hydratase